MKQKEELSIKHEAVWRTLQLVEPGQFITGARLMEHSGIKERRSFHQIIRDLRRAGYPIGSSKQPETRGFFVIRDQSALDMTLAGLHSAALDMLVTAKRIERAYMDDQHGRLF